MRSVRQAGWPSTQIGHFLNYLVIECGLAANTLQAYRRDLIRFGGFCDELKIHNPKDVDPPVMQKYARRLHEQRLATASIARHLTAVRMFMRFHVLNGMVDKDICAALDTPKTWQRLPSVLDKRRTIELVEAGDKDDPIYLRNRALLEVLYATGMRASEAADLGVKDINFQVGYVRCVGKGRKERIIPVHTTALDLVREYLKDLRPQLLGEKDSGHLFISRTGRRLSRVDVWRIVRRAAQAAGLAGKVTPHTLRHCFGSHLLQGGADLRSVQEMLGHADVTTTQIYTHVDQQHLRSVHKKYHPRA